MSLLSGDSLLSVDSYQSENFFYCTRAYVHKVLINDRLPLSPINLAQRAARLYLLQLKMQPSGLNEITQKMHCVVRLDPALVFLQGRLRGLQAGSFVILFTRCAEQLLTGDGLILIHR